MENIKNILNSEIDPQSLDLERVCEIVNLTPCDKLRDKLIDIKKNKWDVLVNKERQFHKGYYTFLDKTFDSITENNDIKEIDKFQNTLSKYGKEYHDIDKQMGTVIYFLNKLGEKLIKYRHNKNKQTTEKKECYVCRNNRKLIYLRCEHEVCIECLSNISKCPYCRINL